MLGSETLGIILQPGTFGLRWLADGGGGVRLRSSNSPLGLALRLSMELPQEDSSSSLSLKSVLSLRKLSSLSTVGLLPHPAPSISTVIMGGGACIECDGTPVPLAMALAG